jgi:hypothetical protein
VVEFGGVAAAAAAVNLPLHMAEAHYGKKALTDAEKKCMRKGVDPEVVVQTMLSLGVRLLGHAFGIRALSCRVLSSWPYAPSAPLRLGCCL